MKNLAWLLLLLIIPMLASCDKEEFTPSGSRLFTCNVNGEAFKSRNDDWKGKAMYSGITNDTLGVSGIYNVGDRSESVGFRIENFSGEGTYILNTNKDNYGRYNLNDLSTFTNANYRGEVTITHYFPEKRIVAGTFSFTTIDPATGKIFQITNGQFDMPF